VSVRPGEPPGIDVDVDVRGKRAVPTAAGRPQEVLREGGAGYAAVHLSFPGDRPQNHGGDAARDVDRQLREALARLAELVSQ
jgi:hypothetical protein